MADITQRIPAVSKSGALVGTVAVVSMINAYLPSTLTLKSAAGGRKIELSTDGGVEYYTPTVDATSATMQIVFVKTSVTHAKFTGAALDTWSIQ